MNELSWITSDYYSILRSPLNNNLRTLIDSSWVGAHLNLYQHLYEIPVLRIGTIHRQIGT